MIAHSDSPLWRRPSTRSGRWATALMYLYLGMYLVNSVVFMPLFGYRTETTWFQANVMPFYGIFMLLCGFGSGCLGLYALTLQKERSWLVWMTLLPFAFTVLLVAGEFLIPH